ncbi:MAG: VOC family protein [Pseudomonadota bacterium]
MKRAFTNILCDDPSKVALFYEAVLGMRRHADFGWFIILTHDDMPGMEFGLLDASHETVPEGAIPTPSGVMLTFVVDDAEACFQRAQDAGAVVVEPPTDMAYGQRRMVVKDPAGTLVDISAPIAPAPNPG